MKMVVSCDVAPCSLVEDDRHGGFSQEAAILITLSGADVKNAWIFASFPTICLHGVALGIGTHLPCGYEASSLTTGTTRVVNASYNTSVA